MSAGKSDERHTQFDRKFVETDGDATGELSEAASQRRSTHFIHAGGTMSRAENRSQMMDQLGAKQVNTRLSWCAVNEKDRRVYFSMWVDRVHKHKGQTRYVIQEPDWGINEAGNRSPARTDHDEKLRLVFDEGYEPFGYFIEAEDPTVYPRQIAGTRTSFVMRLKLFRADDGSVFGIPLERINLN